MSYEKMKEWGFERKKKQFQKAGRTLTPQEDKLVRLWLSFNS
jgi:solute carrier family 25 (mitochondrial folate transporter), member 32